MNGHINLIIVWFLCLFVTVVAEAAGEQTQTDKTYTQTDRQSE